MPQRVRTDPEARAAHADVTGDQPLHAPAGQARAAKIHKQRIALAPLKGRPSRRKGRRTRVRGRLTKHGSVLQPGSDSLLRGVVERDDPLLGALPHHAHHPRAEVYVLDIETDELAEAKPRRIEQL